MTKLFIDKMDSFPPSIEVENTSYNVGELQKAVYENQIMEVCNVEKGTIDQFYAIDKEFGEIVRCLVKQTNVDVAFERYNRLEYEIERLFSGNFYIYARQGALSVKALYYYKNDEYNKAISITIECIALNEYLIQQGLHVLVLRCLEQNRNIARIYFKGNRKNLGYSLLGNLFKYSFNGYSEKLFGNIFTERSYWARNPVLRELYTYNVFAETVGEMIRHNLNEWPISLSDSWYIDLDFEVDTPERQIIYNWIYINKVSNHTSFKEYIDSLIYFFEQPIAKTYDTLKMYLLIELFNRVESDDKLKSKLSEKIRNYMKNCLISNNKMRDSLLRYFA